MYQAKKLIQAERVYKEGYFGEGVTIAILDSGLNIRHPDLKGRLIYFCDYENGRENCYDDNGHGTHVAGIICGNGTLSNGKYAGVAPKANLVILKVLDEKGNGSTEHVLQALAWIRDNYKKYHIRLLNFSIGYLPGAKIDEMRQLLASIDELWDLGVMVIAAAGNKGPSKQSVTVPGISRRVLTVGACDDKNELPLNLKRGYSGKGPTECCIVKPEVLAPGTNIISTGETNRGFGYVEKSGTSMATPIVCGAMALAFGKNPELTPAALKLIVYQSCTPVEASNHHSWGLLCVDQMMRIV